MTAYTSLAKSALLSIFILFILLGAAISTRAAGVPDSVNDLQTILPDTVSLRGKVVYVDFWASWCAPCQQSFPWMQKLYEKYHHQGLEIVAISVDKDHRSALEFLKDTKVTFPIVFDSTGDLAKQYKLETMPTSFIYDRNGRLVSRNRGFKQEETDSLDYTIFHLVNEGKAK